MTGSEQRIFISDLPEAATDKEIRSLFSKYGKVTSIEIKTRKELTPKNKSHFFGYVNLNTDHYNLNECFRDFQNEPWHGDYVKLQIAKESFLDRLKREREEDQKKGKKEDTQEIVEFSRVDPVINIPTPKTPKFESESIKDGRHNRSKKNRIISEEDSWSNIGEEDTIAEKEGRKFKKKSKQLELDDLTVSDINGLDNDQEPALKIRKITPTIKVVNKIPSVGNDPIIVFNTKQEKPKNLSEANLKRLESLKNLKKGYINEKNLIQSALKNIDTQSKNKKIIFDDDGTHDKNINKSIVNGSHKNKNELFNQDDSDLDEFEGNFEIEEHLEGEKGKKLLEMQSKFHNDKRFALDKRFLDETQKSNENDFEEEEESLLTEKEKEIGILEQVLGKKITKPTSKKAEKNVQLKTMLRFDPTQNNSSFELNKVPEEPKKKKSRKELKEEAERAQQIEKPEVSKEVFYKVSDHLKETFQESQGFSLLGTFKKPDYDEDNADKIQKEHDTSVQKTNLSKNPFKYDSSDEEDETADIPHTNDSSKVNDNQQQTKPTSNRLVFWSESFFFKLDDHRLQDGFDFIEKMKVPDEKEFSEVRKGLKGVIRTKVRNSERKNRMFKKKLGGGSKSNRRKHVRIKKALKR